MDRLLEARQPRLRRLLAGRLLGVLGPPQELLALLPAGGRRQAQRARLGSAAARRATLVVWRGAPAAWRGVLDAAAACAAGRALRALRAQGPGGPAGARPIAGVWMGWLVEMVEHRHRGMCNMVMLRTHLTPILDE